VVLESDFFRNCHHDKREPFLRIGPTLHRHLLFKILIRFHPRWHEATQSGSSSIQFLCRLAVGVAGNEQLMDFLPSCLPYFV
jgi:hypothetical protein